MVDASEGDLEVIKASDVTVLVVDDEQDLRDIISDRFRAHGFKVLTASGGNPAWQVLQSEKVNIVITDIRMPDGSGIDLLKNIRKRDFDQPRTFVISGFSGFSLDQVYAMGADGLFPKPFDTRNLIETVRHAFIPRKDRWQVLPIDAPRLSIEQRFESVEVAKTSHRCSLGRGGVFLGQFDDLVEEGVVVNLNLEFVAEKITLRGLGQVVWVRRKDEGQNPRGLGIEIQYLDDASRDWLVAWIEQNRPLAYIHQK